MHIDLYDKSGRAKSGWDSYFVYTAYAPMDDEVLVKVGISTVPFNRLVTIYCNTPFPVELAAFVPVGRKKKALAIERRILERFVEFKTRGEWLRLKTTKEAKKEFSEATRAIVALETGKPVVWQQVTGAQLRAFMASRMKEMDQSLTVAPLRSKVTQTRNSL